MSQNDGSNEAASSAMDESDSSDDACQMAIDNSENILCILRNLYHEKSLCDVFLTVGDKVHAAHRLILCVSSKVFQVMLSQPEWTEWRESQIVLQEHPMCEGIFEHFLQYFYTGHILITHTNVLPILVLADKYIVKSLTTLCVKYMCKHIAHAAAQNQLFSWLQYTMTCNFSDVAQLCLQYIKWNLEAVANSPDFSNFELNLFCYLLKENDVIIYNEVVLYNCALRWLELQEIRLNQQEMTVGAIEETMQLMVDSVMKCIRFPMMTPKEIAGLLPSPLIKKHYSIMLDRMAKGIIYQSGKIDPDDAFWGSDEGQIAMTPRLYTCDSYNTSLIVENVSSLPSYHVATFVFSTHTSLADYDMDRLNEWVVDLYPKGVWFKKCMLIVWQGTLEVPESVKPTVRIALTCREPIEKNLRVRIAVLLYGSQNGSEHIMNVIQRIHHFSTQDNMFVLDNIIPFEEINHNLAECAHKKGKSVYLTGMNNDQLKLNIIITPIS